MTNLRMMKKLTSGKGLKVFHYHTFVYSRVFMDKLLGQWIYYWLMNKINVTELPRTQQESYLWAHRGGRAFIIYVYTRLHTCIVPNNSPTINHMAFCQDPELRSLQLHKRPIGGTEATEFRKLFHNHEAVGIFATISANSNYGFVSKNLTG